ncbi:hypothetical protein [Acutalibacter sp. JLR.KK004]|uniref:hypothetical protein n=1 Tax=Acutalibacter sp. JLR.KK004 TaxID=3112622 RepID=UPI002FEF761B
MLLALVSASTMSAMMLITTKIPGMPKGLRLFAAGLGQHQHDKRDDADNHEDAQHAERLAIICCQLWSAPAQ